MAMLSTGKKANINDQDGAVLSGSKHSVTTSDANAVGVARVTGSRRTTTRRAAR